MTFIEDFVAHLYPGEGDGDRLTDEPQTPVVEPKEEPIVLGDQDDDGTPGVTGVSVFTNDTVRLVQNPILDDSIFELLLSLPSYVIPGFSTGPRSTASRTSLRYSRVVARAPSCRERRRSLMIASSTSSGGRASNSTPARDSSSRLTSWRTSSLRTR